MEYREAHQKALDAAYEAAKAHNEKHGDWDACGFAWVKASVDGRSKAARELKKLGFSKAWNYGYDLWNPSRFPVQSVSTLEAGADAYAKTMNELLGGNMFYAQSRLD